MSFSPTPEQAKIIDLVKNTELTLDNKLTLNPYGYKNCIHEFREYQNDSLDYWILDIDVPGSSYRPNYITFKELSEDVINKVNKLEDLYHGSVREEYMLRFSRRYGTLEYYVYKSEIRDTRYSKGKNVLMHKKRKIFSIRSNNMVLINGNRYISLKNFNNIQYISNNALNILLLNTHLNSNFPIELLRNSSTEVLEVKNIPNKFSKKCSTFEDVLDNMSETPIPKVLKAKFSTQQLIILYTFLDYKEICKFINFIKENAMIYLSNDKNEIDINNPFDNPNIYFYDTSGISRIITEMMAIKLNLIGKCKIEINKITTEKFVSLSRTKEERKLLVDYVNMINQLGERVNINITSLKRLKYLHDAAMVKINSRNIGKIKVAKKYPKTLEDKKTTVSIQLIENSVDLVKEGREMNHCVASYAAQINAGASAIYRVMDTVTGERATMELKVNPYENGKEVFYINQLKGVWNTSPSLKLRETVHSITMRGTSFGTTMSEPMKWVEAEEELPF